MKTPRWVPLVLVRTMTRYPSAASNSSIVTSTSGNAARCIAKTFR